MTDAVPDFAAAFLAEYQALAIAAAQISDDGPHYGPLSAKSRYNRNLSRNWRPDPDDAGGI